MQTLENALEDDRPAEIGDEAPKQVFLSDAVATTTGRLKVPSDWFETESSGLENFISGGIGYVRGLKDFPQNVRIFYGEHQMALGGYFEDAEMVERGKVNIQNAQRNLDKIMEDRATYAPGQKDQESFSYGLGSGAANYGMMLIGGYGIGGAAKLLGAGVKAAGTLAEASGIGLATAIDASGEVQEGIQTYREKTGDDNLENIAPKFATKELGTTYLYASGSAILEKFLGFGQQRKIFKSKFDLSKAGVRKEMFKSAAKEYAKQGVKTGASEGITEMAQEGLNIGIDLADGTINWEQMPERLRGLFMQGAIGAVIGGTAGISAAMYNRRAAKRYLKENLSQVVPAENVDAVVDAVYETGNNELSNVIATELELSSELQNKHGAVYDSMQRAIKRAADESGAFKNYTEDKMAEYINDTSKLFADQVLAEANQRNVVIDEVLKASDIVYEDGGIKLKNKSGITTGQEVFQLPVQAYNKQGKADVNSEAFYNHGTFDPSNGNIYYQGGEGQNIIDGHEVIDSFDENAPDNAFVKTKDGRVEHGYITDELAKQLGSSKGGEIRLYNDLNKHIDKGRKQYILSQGYSDLIDFVDDTISNWERIYKGSNESFLITKSKNKDNVVAVKLEQDGKYYKISTAFVGRNGYLKNKEALAERAATNQLLTKSPDAFSGTSAINNITPTRENVNKTLEQDSKNPKGSYNPNTGVIKIFETADFSTLPHELAHYWLDNMWNYTRSGNASEQYKQRWNVIANWLNVRPEQTRLTRGQQEKFARGYEQYLLNGNLPTPMIKGSFDDYDRWLKRVYGDMNRLNVRLTDDAVRFFQSMTTGKLPAPKLKPMRKKRGKMSLAEKMRERMNIQQQEKQEQEAVNFMNDVEAARPMPDNIIERTVIKSNITEGKTGESRVYNREIEKNIDTLSEIAEDNLEYNKVRLAEQAKKADEFVKNNLDEARKIVDGLKPAPENILDTAIRIAYEQEMLRIGDNAEYLRALKLHSSLQTLRGQEISAERISSPDITSPEYWINKVIANRTHKTAKRLFGGWKSIGESSLELYKNMIKEETDAITKKVLAEKDERAQRKVLNEEIKRLKYEYDIKNNQGELFQMPNNQPLNAKNAKMYVSNALDNLFGTTLTQEEANQIIGKVAEIEKSISTTLDETGNPSIQTWVKINEMNNLVESYTPSPALQIATSIVGRGVMLASLKSPTLNIISNTENILAEMVIRRAINAVEGSATQSAVDRSVVSDYLKYAKDVYKYSGYNVSTTQDIDASIVTLGEQRISTQGKGWYRKFARGIETGVFKYLMGYPDSVSKDIVFSDVASLEATTIALNEGKDGKELTQRANELFIDATRIEPTTEEGRLIRDKAIQEANIATYTNDTALSKLALGIRESLNKATGDVRLGDQLMPFVKTPANVVSLGLEYTAGLAYAIPKLTKIIKDVKAGNITDESRTAIKAAMRNGLGVVLAMLIAAAFDPDDYTPEYDALSPSERRLALEKGAVFNSVRIGNKYISLDYLGPLALPMAAVLTARYREDNPLWGFTAGALSQAAKTPGVGEIYDAIKFIGDSVRKDAQENVENIGNIMLDYVRARTIPSIVNDLAKVFDDVERETSGGTWDKVLNSLPGIRNNLPEKYQTTSPTPRETENIFSTLFFGARVKTAASNRVIYEIDRLYKSGNRVTITDVTRSGKLADLSEEKQQKARREFAKRYYDAVYKLVSSRSYRRKDDEQKAYALNKVRRRIVEELKKELIK